MTRLRHWWGVLALGLVAGCAAPVQTQLHPGPPLVQYVPLRHPFRGEALAVDHQSEAARWEFRHGAPWLAPIADTPQARWVNGPADLPGTRRYLREARQQDALPVLVAYYVPRRGCTAKGGGAPSRAAYLHWVHDLAAAVRGTKTVVVLEPDAVAADCFDDARAATLRQAVHLLDRARVSVYLDAGHPGWRSTGEMAQRLLDSGVADAEGFSVNVSNRQSTQESYRWGRELSDLLGGREFVIDTSRNGLPPPPPGNWCNTRPQALGSPPTTKPGLPGVAALLWVKRPGESDGPCHGETTYGFSPRQARELLSHGPPGAADR